MPEIIFATSVAALWMCVFGIYRNYKVREKLLENLSKVSEACKKDIHDGKDYRWRYEAFSKISYTKMIFIFWKPLDSFFDPKIWQE